MVAVIAFPFMIVVTHQSLPVVNVDQGILVAVRGTHRLGNLIGFHFHNCSKLIDVLCMEDQSSSWHGVLDTIRWRLVKMRHTVPICP
jgi:hypothetical protein